MDLYACISFLFLISLSVGTNPGFKARVTQNGLNYVNKVAIATLAKSVKNLKIPDQSGRSGDVTWTVSGMKMTGFIIPTSSMQLQKTGIHWSAKGAGMSMHGNFRYKFQKGWVKVSDHGSLDAALGGVSFGITVNLGDVNGKPHLTESGCSSGIGGISIHFHGGASWIYNIFSGIIGDKVKGILNAQLCPLIAKAVNTDANAELAKLPMNVIIDNLFLLDYGLTAKPSFNNKFMETYHKGEIYWKNDKRECPLTPHPLGQAGDNSKMLYLWVSDYMGNSLTYNAFKHNFLRYNLTAKDLPPGNRSLLNTTCPLKCIGKLIPQIGQKYPNSSVELRMYATSRPVLTIKPGYIVMNFSGNVDMFAHTPTHQTPFLFTMTNIFVVKVSALIEGQLIKGKITDTQLKVGVKNSKVGPIQPAILQLIMTAAIKMFVVPMLNGLGEKGLILPVTDNIKFSNAQLSLLDGALLVATDLTYLSDQQLKQMESSIKSPTTEHLYVRRKSNIVGKNIPYIAMKPAQFVQRMSQDYGSSKYQVDDLLNSV